MKDFKEKVVVITGGATGIGNALAEKFGVEGAKVILCARRENRLQEAVAELQEKSVEAYYKVCDVTKLEDLKAVADYAFDTFGHVDVLVNNAGLGGEASLIVDASKEIFEKVFNVNVLGMLNGLWAFGRRIIDQGTPAMILNVNSESGLYPPGPMIGFYSASKYAGKAITETLRMEVPEHVQVGAIFPGLVQTELGGNKEMTRAGMPAKEFIDIIWPQIENGEFYIVSHPWGKDYANEGPGELTRSFEKYAPHFEGDQKYDSRWLAQQI